MMNIQVYNLINLLILIIINLLITSFDNVSTQIAPPAIPGVVEPQIIRNIMTLLFGNKVISLAQFAVMSRLLRQLRPSANPLDPFGLFDFGPTRTGLRAIDTNGDGIVDSIQNIGDRKLNRKNFMFFLGKHNIQVSHHGLKV